MGQFSAQLPSEYAGATNLYAIVRSASFQAWRSDTNAFENYTAANVALNRYRVAAAVQGGGAFVVGTVPAAIGASALLTITIHARAGANDAETDEAVAVITGAYDGTDFTSGGTISGIQSVPLGNDLGAAVQNFYSVPLLINGTDSTGWTRFVFVIKGDASDDDDASALLMIKVSNPADAVNDGLNTLNGSAYAGAKSDGTLTITTVAGTSTTATLQLQAAGLNIPPSGSGGYAYELVRYTGTKKESLGRGKFEATRGVWRGVTQP